MIIMSRMLLLSSSTSCVLVLLAIVCFSQQCRGGRHLITSIGSSSHDHAHKPKLLSRSTIKGLKDDPFNMNNIPKGKDQISANIVHDDHQKQATEDCRSNSKKVKTIFNKELDHHHPPKKSMISFRVPAGCRQQQQPGFNLDYSPPKTHPPTHN